LRLDWRVAVRACPHCNGPVSRGVSLQPFQSALMELPVISCKPCGVSMCLPKSEIEAAWNRRDTDELLLECLGIVKMTILLFVDHGIDPAREIELLTKISTHLAKGGSL
jgi:hypothetical protein